VAGRAYLWSLNERHPIVPALRSLFRAESNAIQRRKGRLRRILVQAGGVRRAIVFGSAARGQEDASSDLDLLVVVSNREALGRVERSLAELRLDSWGKGGMRLSPLLYTAAEFERKRHLPVIEAAEREGEELLAEERR
jgi:predicted nucleotidyltransferase